MNPANSDLIFDQAGMDLVQLSESTKLTAYPDPGTGGAPWTNGIGHTGPDVYPGQVIDHAQALVWLSHDVEDAADTVRRLVSVPLNQNQFDALVDLVFNIGEKQFASSTLLRKINAGDYAGAQEQFGRWNLSAGKVMGGLTNRRAAEADLFSTTPTEAST